MSSLDKIGTKIIIFFVLVFSFGLAYATESEQMTNYEVKIAHEQSDKKTQILLIYALSPNVDFDSIETVKNFVGVLESHWYINIDIVNFIDLGDEYKNEKYEKFIFLEQLNDPSSIEVFTRVLKENNKPYVWIGYGTDKLLNTKNKDFEYINEGEVGHIVYKDVLFDKGTFFKLLNYSKNKKNDSDLINLVELKLNNGETLPFIQLYKKQNLIIPTNLPDWYQVNNYTVPFLDVFHYAFGHHNDLGKKALLRLEDVNPYTYKNPKKLLDVHDYLINGAIPYHIALIERFIDPEKNIDLNTSESENFLQFIKFALQSKSVYLVQHGYTHQYGDEVSGVGFEFWDSKINSTIKFESEKEASDYTNKKISDVQDAMEKSDLPQTDIWEFPHYRYSTLDNEIINTHYPIRYESIPDVGSLPFVAKINGTIYIPENLGYFHEGDELEEKKQMIKQLATFEDPVFSFFWHPWRDKEELEKMVDFIRDDTKATFVSAYSLLDYEDNLMSSYMSSISRFDLYKKDLLVYVVISIFLIGSIVFIRNVFLVKKYISKISKFNLSLDRLLEIAKENNVELPKLALFVPARNEGLVIGNTIKRIAKLDYPKEKLNVYIIVDERELDDGVEKTTKEVALSTAEIVHVEAQCEFIKIIEVPKWYSGYFNDLKKIFGKSTKGRALNFCLQSIDCSDIELIGILDADGRLHRDVLKEVAYNRIVNNSRLLQGPVFQVNNYKDVSIVGKTAGLELALHHLTELPNRLNKKNKIQFLAGTNYFIDPVYIISAGGWDQTALVEDAEIALRLYIKNRIVGDWLNSPELEQSPANYSIYKKQRERWVRGHLDLLKQINNSTLPLSEKIYLYQKILFSQARFILDVGLPILAIYLMFTGGFQNQSDFLFYLSVFLLFISIFIWDTYGFIFRNIKNYIEPEISNKKIILVSLKHLLFLPVFIIVQAVPRITALYKFLFDKNNNVWYKTERTAEKPL